MTPWTPVKTAAKQCGTSDHTIYRHIKKGHLPHKTIWVADNLGRKRQTLAIRTPDLKHVLAATAKEPPRRDKAIEEIHWLLSFGWSESAALARIANAYQLHPGNLAIYFNTHTQNLTTT